MAKAAISFSSLLKYEEAAWLHRREGKEDVEAR